MKRSALLLVLALWAAPVVAQFTAMPAERIEHGPLALSFELGEGWQANGLMYLPRSAAKPYSGKFPSFVDEVLPTFARASSDDPIEWAWRSHHTLVLDESADPNMEVDPDTLEALTFSFRVDYRPPGISQWFWTSGLCAEGWDLFFISTDCSSKIRNTDRETTETFHADDARMVLPAQFGYEKRFIYEDDPQWNNIERTYHLAHGDYLYV